MELAAGDRVRIVGLVQSDCLGVTGIVLDVKPSTLFGPRHKRCRVDFKGRVRGILSCNLVKVEEKPAPEALAS
jgi:hypothetical protein